jgi:hypothetical protein
MSRLLVRKYAFIANASGYYIIAFSRLLKALVGMEYITGFTRVCSSLAHKYQTRVEVSGSDNCTTVQN